MLQTWRIYFLSVCLVGSWAFAQESKVSIPEITNWKEIEKNLKLAAFKSQKMKVKIKIAVLDNGFNGHESLIGNLLPKSVVYDKGAESAADPVAGNSIHGTFMALIAAQIIERSGAEADYEMKLFNTFGYTKFKYAVEKVIEEKFDVVLYSQVWEFGGNGDGKGFINALVDKAVAAGVIWINAAGNFGHLTRITAVDGKQEGQYEYVVFKNRKGQTEKGAKIFCKIPAKQKCHARMVLAWNDFQNDANWGTDKDLDLIVIDEKGKELTKSERRQKLVATSTDSKDVSLVPRELLEFDLSPGQYWLRARVISKNFSPSQDKLRITVSGTGVELADADRDETLLPPADNPGVIVIGATDDFQSSRSVSKKLPEVNIPSAIKLKDGSIPFSTSIAAAMAAGLTVLHLGVDTEKSKAAVIEKLKTVSGKIPKLPDEKSKPADKGIPMNDPGDQKKQRQPGIAMAGNPGPAAPSTRVVTAAPAVPCLPLRPVPFMYQTVANLLASGIPSVNYRGWTILLATVQQVPQLAQMGPGMRLFISPEGLIPILHAEVMARSVPANYYEVLPIYRYRICN